MTDEDKQPERNPVITVIRLPIFSPNRLIYALHGMRVFFSTQNSALIIITATTILVVGGIIAGLTRTEWLFLVIGIGLVWAAEVMNTAIEFVCDSVTVDFHPFIKKAKDAGAGSVLVAAVLLSVITVVIFWPYVF